MMRLKQKFIKLSALIAILIMSLSACKSEKQVNNEEKFAKLNPQELAQAQANTKQEIVNRLICSRFSSEIHEYSNDIKNKQLKMHWQYFWKYPHQFEITKLYYRSTVAELLKRNAVYDYEASSMNNMTAPPIETLPCQDTIANWTQLQHEFSQIKAVMPMEYFYEESWSYKFEKAKRWVGDLFSDIFNVLLYIAAFIYAFTLHKALIKNRNQEGFFLIVVTPFLALPFVKEFRNFLPFHTEKWEAWLIGSLFISLTFTAVILIYLLIDKNRKDDNELSIVEEVDLSVEFLPIKIDENDKVIDGIPDIKGTSVAPKYRNPNNTEQTWSGRGRAPKWAAELKAEGKLESALTQH